MRSVVSESVPLLAKCFKGLIARLYCTPTTHRASAFVSRALALNTALVNDLIADKCTVMRTLGHADRKVPAQGAEGALPGR